MKIVFLNAWNGKMKSGITRFVKEQSADTDVFCFQEVSFGSSLFCGELLTGYDCVVFRKSLDGINNFSQAMYVNKKLKLSFSEALFEKEPALGLGVYVKIKHKKGDAHICNFHGIAHPGDKLDNSNKLKQSSELINFFKDKRGPKIIGGDFNLLPETKSIKIFEGNGYKNLIKDFSIPTTRNKLAWKRFDGNKQYFADYVFVSNDVDVKSFSVPNIKISDHLPLILEVAL